MKSVFDPMHNFRQWDELDCESDDWIESQNEQKQERPGGDMDNLSKAAVIVRLISSLMLFLGIAIFLYWFFF